ncbi:Sporulation stage V, protein R [Moorella glycerini]|uniref:SpoVR family protein n=1 Tax=Neomoorella stamsii TaxID=1266720 RepID=A0A9X7P783_9FIRM|nr:MULTISPECIES: SpoVR family protein [Moorella]PRR76332.1 SpoVR family protein [Moorella stamsii]CEP67100.1 Sporulation stage V, protein R [Moorella glycerini]
MEQEFKALAKAIEAIHDQARKFGLDFFPMRFELVPADVIYAFGAYGMPTRFTHWTFGKHFYKMKLQYDFNLSRIYELVINSNPCYAFLLEGNDLIQNKLVIAHVFAHSDFFKNNVHFAPTSRQMVETMAVHAAKIREYEFKYGHREVEIFLDAALSIQEHIEPPAIFPVTKEEGEKEKGPSRPPETPYDDLWALDGKPKEQPRERSRKIPPRPTKDMLAFIMNNSPELEDWQRDILAIVREEMRYFWPQMETKIINEGWATYWHARIMRELDLTEEETIEFAHLHASVSQPGKMQINPYYVGSKIFEDIEKRWDNPSQEEREKYGRKGGEGRAKIFEVRTCENDISFLRNYLTRELVEELDLFLYQKVGSEWVVVEKDWEKVRDGLVGRLTNCGFPYIVVEDGDYQRRGELYLKHCYEGLELDVPYLEKTLPYVYLLWGRPVHLETVIDGKTAVFSYDGKKNSRR